MPSYHSRKNPPDPFGELDTVRARLSSLDGSRYVWVDNPPPEIIRVPCKNPDIPTVMDGEEADLVATGISYEEYRFKRWSPFSINAAVVYRRERTVGKRDEERGDDG